MVLFKCTEHGSLHKTQQSGKKLHVCHYNTAPFKRTAHELMANICAIRPNTTIVHCYHFNQEVSTIKKEKRDTLCSTPQVIVYELGDTCELHEWLLSDSNCTSFLFNSTVVESLGCIVHALYFCSNAVGH